MSARRRSVLLAGFALALLSGGAKAQTGAHDPGSVTVLQQNLFGPFSPGELEQIKAGHALSVFERKFERTDDPGWRLVKAAELVRLGDDHSLYWNVLSNEAQARIASEDVNEGPGKNDGTSRDPAAAKYHLSPANLDSQVCEALVRSGDVRSLPLLRQALESRRTSLRSSASEALARLHDTVSIPQVVEAIRKSTAKERAWFDVSADPAFVAAARPLLPQLNQDPLLKLAAGDCESTVAQLANGHVLAAIPPLKVCFASEEDQDAKDKVASALVQLGVKDQVYWDYLVEEARPAAESDAPQMFTAGPDGKGVYTPAFLAWAAQHHVSLENGDAVYGLPGRVMAVAVTGDPRGVPLLRRALSSGQLAVPVPAAMGLAQIPDKASIPLLLELCRQKPDLAPGIAMFALVYFDDDAAQEAARRYIPADPPGVWDELKSQRGTRPFDSPPLPASAAGAAQP